MKSQSTTFLVRALDPDNWKSWSAVGEIEFETSVQNSCDADRVTR